MNYCYIQQEDESQSKDPEQKNPGWGGKSAYNLYKILKNTY